jgi:hypothetical protein
VTQKARPNATTTPATYTVDAANAQVMKNGATSTVASIAIGDTVMVQGAVSGTNVAATMIRDGAMTAMGQRGMPGNYGKGNRPTSTPAASPIQGNGEPVVAGNVTAISGSSLTVTNASNVTYTIDISNATIVKSGATTTIASVAVGDNVIAQGVVEGASVTASSLIDQGSSNRSNGTPTNAPSTGSRSGLSGFFGAIGNFFKHIFGF